MSEEPSFDPNEINPDELRPTVPFEGASPVEQSVYETAYKNARLMLENEKLLAQNTTFARSLFHRDDHIRELNQENKVLESIGRTDSLTGLMNKVAWKQEASAAIERANKDGGQFGVLFIDLTNFKWVNDSISHQEGDRVLVDMADLIQHSVRQKNTERPSDLIAREQLIGMPAGAAGRYGGDEFALFVDLTPEEDNEDTAGTAAERLQTVVDKLRDAVQFFLEEEPQLHEGGFDIAIGGSVWRKDMPLEELLQEADDAMKADKERQHREKGKYR